jgi:hypothetical protein
VTCNYGGIQTSLPRESGLQVIKLKASGNDKKAEIMFDKGDIKKLLLRFAKLEV